MRQEAEAAQSSREVRHSFVKLGKELVRVADSRPHSSNPPLPVRRPAPSMARRDHPSSEFSVDVGGLAVSNGGEGVRRAGGEAP